VDESLFEKERARNSFRYVRLSGWKADAARHEFGLIMGQETNRCVSTQHGGLPGLCPFLPS
jgi:hypothetical protein